MSVIQLGTPGEIRRRIGASNERQGGPSPSSPPEWEDFVPEPAVVFSSPL